MLIDFWWRGSCPTERISTGADWFLLQCPQDDWVAMGGRSALEDYVARHIPMGRWGTPEEIAQGIVFLASDRSTCVTWHALVIGGAECL